VSDVLRNSMHKKIQNVNLRLSVANAANLNNSIRSRFIYFYAPPRRIWDLKKTFSLYEFYKKSEELILKRWLHNDI